LLLLLLLLLVFGKERKILFEHVTRSEYVRNTLKSFAGNLRREGPFVKSTRRWKDNIRKTKEQHLKDWTGRVQGSTIKFSEQGN
jgi:hypothetical protein